MNNHLNILPKPAKCDLKLSKMRRWLGLRPRPVWGSLQRSPDPLIVSGFAPKALAPQPLRRLKADPPSFLGANLTLVPTATYRQFSSYFILSIGRRSNCE